MKVTVDVDGLSDLTQSLRRLRKSTGKAVLKRSLQKSAAPMLADMRQAAPGKRLTASVIAATSIDGGAAGRSAFSRAMKTGHSRSVARLIAHRANASTNGAFESALFVGPNEKMAYLARWFEFGTADRFHKKTGRHVGAMPALPFMRPTWDAGSDDLLDAITANLRAEITKAIARAAKAGRLLE